MGREPRGDTTGGVFHVTSRGNNQEPLFFDDFDWASLIHRLSRAAGKYRLRVFAYCLMGNHYHLVVAAPFGGLSEAIQWLNGGYSRRTNRRYGRSGHLFHNRFAARSVESDGHLLEACRYTVLNPVRASLCSSPEEWIWSSYRACAGLELAPPFLAEAELLALFGSRPAEARAAYRAFVAAGHVRVSDTVTGE